MPKRQSFLKTTAFLAFVFKENLLQSPENWYGTPIDKGRVYQEDTETLKLLNLKFIKNDFCSKCKSKKKT